MAKKIESSSVNGTVGPASTLAILGVQFGVKPKAPKVPVEVIHHKQHQDAKARGDLKARILAFASVDGANDHVIDPEVWRSRI